MCTKRDVFLILLTVAITTISLTAQNSEKKNTFFDGVTVFKISPGIELKQELLEKGLTGIAALDSILLSIGANSIERTFPFCDEPELGKTDLTRIYTVHYPETISVQSVCRRLEKIEIIEYAEPWYICYPIIQHNDPRREEQWGLDICHANEAHDIHIGNTNTPVAIIDTGMDMDHPDLTPNLWVNPGEDLNHDRRIQDWEINGIDDDNNGAVDDFHGWDFHGHDNDPEDDLEEGEYRYWGHGTHCAGIASAATNNHRGVASLGFNCPIIAIRGGRENIRFGYQAIVYAANCRAKIISCSWGGGEPTEWCQQSINYAYEHGALVIAGAGNDNLNSPFYPAAFHHVVSVAATTSNDRKADFSNYGGWVDISAPGVGIMSTFVEGGYGYLSGTSMATPFAAGLALLIWSTYPDIGPDAVEACMRNAADNIDGANPRYENQLGAGRINALRSLEWSRYPRLVMHDPEIHHYADQPGITLGITLAYRNIGNTVSARNLTAEIHTNDPSLDILTPHVLIDPVAPRQEIRNDEFPFLIEVNPDAIPHEAILSVSLRIFHTSVAENLEISIPVGEWVDNSIEESLSPQKYFVSTAFPNPFNSTTTISCFLPTSVPIKMQIFNFDGRLIENFANNTRPAGNHLFVFDGTGLPAGIYFARFESEEFSSIRKISLIK